SDSVTQNIIVYPQPTASFSVNDSTQCLSGNSFAFTNSSTGASIYNWNFGDGNSSTQTNPSHAYINTGAFTVKLISTTSNGCSDSSTKTLAVYPQPTAGFSVNDSTQCLRDNSFAFTNSSSGASTYSWNFGDGNFSAQTNPNYVYINQGTFTVKLISTTSNGCSDSSTKTVKVYPQPIALFNINDNTQCLSGNSFSFINSSAVASNYNWSFGDGDSSTQISPNHTYVNPGMFNVKVFVTNSIGCADSLIKTVTVYPQPTAGFSVNDNIQCLGGNSFSFTNSSLGASTYNWIFGDGNFSTQTNPTYVYTNSGTFNVKMFAINSDGCSDSSTKNITLYPQPNKVEFLLLNKSIQCISGNNFVFQNKSVGAISFLWLFGDGDSSSNFLTNHSFNNTGDYQIKLYGFTKHNCIDSNSIKVDVKAMPVADFEVNDSAQCLRGNKFEFLNKSTVISDSLNFEWAFGDANYSNIKNPIHSYNNGGNFNVKLKAISEYGCENELIKNIYVYEMPVADFITNDSTQCLLNNEFVFTNNSKNSSSYNWSLGDGTNSTKENNTHTYNSSGEYSVVLISVSDKACIDTIEKDVIVYEQPIIDLGNDTSLTYWDSILLDAGQGFASYLWNDDSTAQTKLIKGNLLAVGNYQYSVVVHDLNACSTSDTIIISIIPSAINDEDFKTKIKLFPNPCGNLLNIKIEGITKQKLQIELIDFYGRSVYREELNTVKSITKSQIDMTDYSKGIYLIKFSSAEFQFIERVVKK
ncbi:MAG: PKD domain-containing protein, partial [Bacteroidota bacterium]|nr:PKD domain-containing protein [Bacteroidota bacterium]